MRVPRVYGPHLPARTRTHTVGRKRSQQCHGPTVMAGAARHRRERTAPPPRPLRAPRAAPMAPLLIVRLAGEAKRGGEGGERGAPCGARRPAANTRFSRAERALFSADATHQYTFRISPITRSTNSLK